MRHAAGTTRAWGARAACALFVGCLLPGAAQAEDKSACLAAHVDAQALRRQGKLRGARERLLLCTREGCPALVRKDCTPWLLEVENEQPSVVISARDATGQQTATVRVLIDGEVVATSLDGRPVDVDPGQHAVRFELPTGEALQAVIMVTTGEKARALAVDFSPPPPPLQAPPSRDTPPAPPAPASVSRSVPPAAFVVGAVGVLGLGGFAYFGLTGKARESQLDSSCAPRCQQSDADHLRMTYLAADISLGVGVAALGIATWIAVASVSRRAPPTGTWLEVHPLLGGAGAGVVGHFQ